MANLIDGVTPLPANGDTGWGTTLNAAINAIDGRFTYSASKAIANYAAASGLTGTTLASTVVSSSLTSVGTLTSLSITGGLTVGGDLTVNGTTTTISTTQLLVEDNIITLNSTVTGAPSTNAGVEVERGTSDNVAVRWNETSDVWEFTNDGTTYLTFASLSGSESLTNKKLGSLTSNGIVTTSSGDGTLSVTATTGSGNVVLATSPAVATSITTASASFDLINTSATTVNFAGGATALSIGSASGTTTVNNALTVSGTTTLGPAAMTQQSSNYTLALGDQGKVVEMTNSSAATVTIPANGTTAFPIGTQITVIRNNAGVQFVPDTDVILLSDSSKQYLATQYSAGTLVKRATNTWYLIGNLSAS